MPSHRFRSVCRASATIALTASLSGAQPAPQPAADSPPQSRPATAPEPTEADPALPTSFLSSPAPVPFGAQGARQAVFGTGVGFDSKSSTDLTGFAQLTWFIVDDVELGGEVGAWYFDQEGENAAGASLAALIRWHFVNQGRLSLFVDGGLGLLAATDEVPDEGTELNFMPRAGVGATYRPWDNDLRLITGVRWHHISNARSSGADDNPSRDGAMLYVGLVVPF